MADQEVARLIIRVVAEVKGVKKDLAVLKGDVKDFSDRSGEYLESLKKNWMAVSVAIISAYYTITKIYDLAERGAKVMAVEESFASMARNFNIAGDALIKKLEEVTKGTIDSSDLMAKALRLISESFSEKQIVGIGEAARISTRLTGKTVSEAYDAISDSILMLREKGLKTAGIIIDLDKAEQQHAKTLGVGKEQLSDYGRRMAWTDAIMEKTKEDAAKLGDSLDKLNEYEKFQKWGATWQEFGETMAKFAATIGQEIIPEATKLLNFLLKLTELAGRVGKGENIPEAISKTIGNREAWLKARMNLGLLQPEEFEELQGLRTPKPTEPAIGGVAGIGGGGPSQIKVNPYVMLYGMTEEELKDRMSYSKLMYDVWKQDYGIIPPDFQDLYGMTEEEFKDRMSYSKLLGEAWKEEYGLIPPSFEDLYGMSEEEFKDRMSYSKLMAEEWKQEYIESPTFEDLYGMSEDEFKDRMSYSKLMGEAWLEEYTKPNEMGETFAQNMASAWNFNIKNIITESKNMGDAIKNVFLGMADAFTSAVSKMISDWILFGNIMGKYKTGEGIIGWLGGGLGSLFGGGGAGVTAASGVSSGMFSLATAQQGGLVKGPAGIDKVPALLTAGELVLSVEDTEMLRRNIMPALHFAMGGQVPSLSFTSGGQVPSETHTHTYNIDARGSQRGVSTEIMRAIRLSENRAVIRSVNQVADNKVRGGKFSHVFEK